MYAHPGAIPARWRVAWVSKGKVISKDLGEDFAGALSLYVRALDAGKKGATLISSNVGFDPPEKLRPRHVRVKRKGRWVEGEVHPLRKLNREGIWWCPHCVKLRKFEIKRGFKSEGVYVPEPTYMCPMCGISHKSGTVRKWNPVASRIYNEPGKRLGRADGKPKKRRRR